MTSPSATSPYIVPMTVDDEIPVGVDLWQSVPAGGGVGAFAVTLTNIDDGTEIALSPTATIGAGATGQLTLVTQVVLGSNLVSGQTYELKVVFDAGTDTVLSTTTQIVVS